MDLILELAGGSPEPEVNVAGSVLNFRRSVTLRKGRCSQVLGTEVAGELVGATLKRFGLTTQGDHVWHIPSFRQDLTREIDLVEEVSRVFGIENIPARETSRYVESTATDRAHDRDMQLRRTLAARGFYRGAHAFARGGKCGESFKCSFARPESPCAGSGGFAPGPAWRFARRVSPEMRVAARKQWASSRSDAFSVLKGRRNAGISRL